jgi:hypothetical protein
VVSEKWRDMTKKSNGSQSRQISKLNRYRTKKLAQIIREMECLITELVWRCEEDNTSIPNYPKNCRQGTAPRNDEVRHATIGS